MPENTPVKKCPECQSMDTSKDGFARTWVDRKLLRIQRYRCKSCGRSFRDSKNTVAGYRL